MFARYVELTDEQREKLEKSYKVAKKLERLQQKREDGSVGRGESVGRGRVGGDGGGSVGEGAGNGSVGAALTSNGWQQLGVLALKSYQPIGFPC